MNSESKFMKAVKLVNLISMLCLVVELAFLINNLQRITFAIAIFTYLTEVIVEKKWRQLRWENSFRQWFFIVIIFYFLLQFLYFPFEKNTALFGTYIEERIPFLIFGIVGLLGFNSYFKLKYFAWTFIITSFLIGVFLLSKMTPEIWNSENRNSLFGLIRIQYVNQHMKLNYYFNLSLIFSYYLLVHYARKRVLWPRFALIIVAAVIVVNLFLSEGRVGLITSFVLLTMFIIRYFWHKSRILTFVSTSLFILLAIALVKGNPRLSEENLKREPRLVIWKIAVDEIVKSDFAGVGVSTAANNMTIEFAKRGMFNNKHTHNVFLQSTLEYGVIGLLVTFAMFILGYYSVSHSFSLIMSFLLMTTLMQLMMGSFERDLNPTVFLICFILIVQQDLADKKKLAVTVE